jgi:hypothetical protein
MQWLSSSIATPNTEERIHCNCLYAASGTPPRLLPITKFQAEFALNFRQFRSRCYGHCTTESISPSGTHPYGHFLETPNTIIDRRMRREEPHQRTISERVDDE